VALVRIGVCCRQLLVLTHSATWLRRASQAWLRQQRTHEYLVTLAILEEVLR
jgi:hypothetical protein